MTNNNLQSSQLTAIQPTLEWTIEKCGLDFFTVRWLWTRPHNVFRLETRSNLENINRYQNIFGGLTNWGLAAEMRNAARMIRGEDKEQVKVYAYRLVARISPAKRRILLHVPTVAIELTEGSVPTVARHQEIELPIYSISVTNFNEAICEQEMIHELHRLGLPKPVSVDYSSEYHYLPRPGGEDAIRRLPKVRPADCY